MTDLFPDFGQCIIDMAFFIFTGTGATPATSLGDGGRPTAATFNIPHGVWANTAGTIYVVEHTGGKVRRIIGNVISTIAGEMNNICFGH